MYFEPNKIYHIYNQGNNREPIFFQERNYYFFLRKMKIQLFPLVDFLAYCLMPNHFHWLVYTRPEACLPCCAVKPRKRYVDGEEAEPDHQQALCHGIGKLLSSYARAINKQEERSGSLFRKQTKAKNGWIDVLITLDGRHQELFFRPDNDYALQCMRYIHWNPVAAGLAPRPEDWKFSSYRYYAGLRRRSLCKKRLARRLLGEGVTMGFSTT